MALAVKPTSLGAVTLRTANPYVKPRVSHNYLATEEDRETVVAGVRMALEFVSTPPLSGLVTGTFSAPDRNASDAELWDFVRANTMGVFHPTSSCAIGPVVDARLRVHGIEGLRVVDASVMPSVVRGNANAPTIMIAEKAADLIGEDARRGSAAKATVA